jgi:sugar phosphate isomerase/epimerase
MQAALGTAPDLERLSFNQMTCDPANLTEAVEATARAGLKWIGVWRHKIPSETNDIGEVGAYGQQIRDAGLRVSGLCRGGMFPALSAEERQRRLDDNFRALDEAAALETDTLVMVCGGLPVGSRDVDGARSMVVDGVAAMVPHAKARGVRIGIEPLHPMYAADRSVVSTLGLANDMAEEIGSDVVGVVIDVYHVWWDPQVYREIERARGRIFGFHVCDWLVPTPHMLMGRGMMGDGVIEIARLRQVVDAQGYEGPIECEIFNQAVWDTPIEETIAKMKRRYLEYC